MTRTVDKDKLAVCKKCGSNQVTWNKSRKTGKFYLTEVFLDEDREFVTDRTDFHSSYCDNQDRHDAKQASITKDDGGEEISTAIIRAMELSASATGAETAAYFLKLHDLCKNDPAKAEFHAQALMVERFNNGDRHSDEWKRLDAEISFCMAALGITQV